MFAKNNKLRAIIFVAVLLIAGFALNRSHANAQIESLMASCQTGSQDGAITCWQKAFTVIVPKYGVTQALRVMESYRQKNDLFRANCHIFAHAIGEAGFGVFRSRAFTAQTGMTSCGFGFYHGFMQEFVSHGGTAAEAKRLCATQSDGAVQCAHGVGHGMVYGSVSRYGLSELPLIAGGIQECAALFSDAYECINGVFGGIALLYFGVHGLAIEPRKDDPFWACRAQEEVYQKRCYDQMVPVVYGIRGGDFQATGRELVAINNAEIVSTVIAHLAFIPIHQNPLRHREDALRLGERVFADCRAIGAYVDACMGGFVKSIVFTELVPTGASWAWDVCATLARPQEREFCFAKVMEQVGFTYSKSDAQAFCAAQTPDVRATCKQIVRNKDV